MATRPAVIGLLDIFAIFLMTTRPLKTIIVFALITTVADQPP